MSLSSAEDAATMARPGSRCSAAASQAIIRISYDHGTTSSEGDSEGAKAKAAKLHLDHAIAAISLAAE